MQKLWKHLSPWRANVTERKPGRENSVSLLNQAEDKRLAFLSFACAVLLIFAAPLEPGANRANVYVVAQSNGDCGLPQRSLRESTVALARDSRLKG